MVFPWLKPTFHHWNLPLRLRRDFGRVAALHQCGGADPQVGLEAPVPKGRSLVVLLWVFLWEKCWVCIYIYIWIKAIWEWFTWLSIIYCEYLYIYIYNYMYIYIYILLSIDWFKGKKIQENPMIFMGNRWFTVDSPLNQSIEMGFLGKNAVKNQATLYWLVVYLPLWKIWKSIGMMNFPIYGKMKNVPKHQPVIFPYQSQYEKTAYSQYIKEKKKWSKPTSSMVFLENGAVDGYP